MESTAAVVEKTEEELRKEIEELQRQQWEISERIRDPRGLRRAGLAGNGARNNVATTRQRGVIRPADRLDSQDHPPQKRRLSSAVVKVEEGEITEDAKPIYAKRNALDGEDNGGVVTGNRMDRNASIFRQTSWAGRDNKRAATKMDFEAHVPRVLPKEEDPKMVKRNKRMLGQLLGTLEKFRKEDVQLSGTEAYQRRSNSLHLAEQKAQEERERLRQQEREELSEKRKRDLTLRARVAAKAEEKRLELLFLKWSEHQKKLCSFLRTKADPPIYYTVKKPLEEDSTLVEQQKEQIFQEWKAKRREELSQYQKQIGEQNLANVENELERWQNARQARRGGNNNMMNLQETMDQELETHRLEHGPKTRKLPGAAGGNDDDEDDVEDINGAEDDMIDDVLEVDESSRRVEETVKPEEAGNASSLPDNNGNL